jgi:hypothetical protein
MTSTARRELVSEALRLAGGERIDLLSEGDVLDSGDH